MASPTGYALKPHMVFLLQEGMEPWGRVVFTEGNEEKEGAEWLCFLCFLLRFLCVKQRWRGYPAVDSSSDWTAAATVAASPSRDCSSPHLNWAV